MCGNGAAAKFHSPRTLWRLTSRLRNWGRKNLGASEAHRFRQQSAAGNMNAGCQSGSAKKSWIPVDLLQPLHGRWRDMAHLQNAPPPGAANAKGETLGRARWRRRFQAVQAAAGCASVIRRKTRRQWAHVSACPFRNNSTGALSVTGNVSNARTNRATRSNMARNRLLTIAPNCRSPKDCYAANLLRIEKITGK